MRRESSRHLRRIDRGELRTDPSPQAPPAGSYAESSMLEAWNPYGRVWDGRVLYVPSRAMFRVRRAHEAMGIPSLHRVPTNHLLPRAPRVLEERLHARKALLRAATLTVVPAVSSPAVLRGPRVRRLPLARRATSHPGQSIFYVIPPGIFFRSPATVPPPWHTGCCLFFHSSPRIWRMALPPPILYALDSYSSTTSTSGSLIADCACDASGIVG